MDDAPCDQTCGGGHINRTCTITTAAANGGTACPCTNGATELNAACNTHPCAVNCVGAWSAYDVCNATCGGGNQTSTYIVATPSAYGGTTCEAAHGATDTQACNTDPCNCTGTPSALDNVTWSCSNETAHEAACSGSCVAGYTANGTIQATCFNGAFVNSTGSCTPGEPD